MAGGLSHGGHEVVVLEQAAALRDAGAGISVWCNGSAAMARLGYPPAAAHIGRRIDQLSQRRSDGSLISRLDVAGLCRRLGSPVIALARRDLLGLLAAGLPATALRFDATAADVHQTTGRATVTLSDGGTVHGDVVVGADGHDSVVRRHLTGTTGAAPTGWQAWQGLHRLRLPIADGHDCVTLLGREGFCGLIPCGGGLVQWWFDVRGGVLPRSTGPTAAREWLRNRFARWAAPVPDLLEQIPAGGPAAWPYHRHRVPRQLGIGRITMLGDAVHAMPPQLAQGANQALDDAAVLCRELSAHAAEPAIGIRCYQRDRRWRAAAAVWLSMKAPAHSLAMPWNRLGMPSGVTGLAFTALLRTVSDSV